MSRFNYDDVEELERMRRDANYKLDNPGDDNVPGLVVLGAIGFALWLFFSWVHNSIAKFTGPEVATWIVWIGVACVAALFVYLLVGMRTARSNVQRTENARRQRVIAEANEKATDVILRSKNGLPGLFAEYWQGTGLQKYGDPDLLKLETAVHLILVEAYGRWTLRVLAEQGHDRLVDDDVIAVFGVHRGIRIAEEVWARLDAE
jgi:membrane protein implicated in regulation of membrane protease activity